MKKHWYKLFGNVPINYIEINIDFSRWLLGFGWYGWNIVHFNFGPLAIIKYKSKY